MPHRHNNYNFKSPVNGNVYKWDQKLWGSEMKKTRLVKKAIGKLKVVEEANYSWLKVSELKLNNNYVLN